MPKKLWMGLVGLGVLLPMAVLGQSPTAITEKAIFQLDPNDPALRFLGQIFGTVGTVLHGVGGAGQLLGQIFRIFNIGVLMVAGIFFMWSTVLTVVQTAHEGQFMGGSKTKPAFTILRTVAGFGLLVPNFSTGYSMIQAAVMWVILQGVGLANTAWDAALDYLEGGGVIFSKPQTTSAELVDMGGTILAAQVCMYYHEKKARDAPGGSTRFIPAYRPTLRNDRILFPKDPGNAPGDNGCGQFSWNWKAGKFNDYIVAAIQQVIIDTQTAARRIVDPRGYKTADLCRTTTDAVIGAAADWTNILLPALSAGKGMDAKTQQFFADARKNGWLYAGNYYYLLTELQQQFTEATAIKFTADAAINGIAMCAGSATCDYIRFSKTGGEQCSGTGGVINLSTNDPLLRSMYQKVSSFVADAREMAEEIDAEASNMPQISAPSLGLLTPLMSPITDGIMKATSQIDPEGGVEPLIAMKSAGENMLNSVAMFMLVSTIVMFALSMIASMMSSISSIGYAIRDMLSIFMVILSPLLMILLTQGILLGTYIPLIPFIIYTFGVVGWFLVVVEALVAAPLVALGLTYPEGHEAMGKAEHAILLLLNVFIRPILMVFGLFAAMVVSRVAVEILSTGLMTILGTMGSINIFMLLGIMFVYLALVIQVLNTTYGLITMVPDRVIRWIGGQVEQTPGVQEALGAAAGAAKEVGSAVGKSMEAGAAKIQAMGDKKGGGGPKGPSGSGSSKPKGGGVKGGPGGPKGKGKGKGGPGPKGK